LVNFQKMVLYVDGLMQQVADTKYCNS